MSTLRQSDNIAHTYVHKLLLMLFYLLQFKTKWETENKTECIVKAGWPTSFSKILCSEKFLVYWELFAKWFTHFRIFVRKDSSAIFHWKIHIKKILCEPKMFQEPVGEPALYVRWRFSQRAGEIILCEQLSVWIKLILNLVRIRDGKVGTIVLF